MWGTTICSLCIMTLRQQLRFLCVSPQSYKVVKGTSKSLTDEMCTVTRTTDISMGTDSKLTWCEMWEIDALSIMKEDFIEKDKDCSKYE